MIRNETNPGIPLIRLSAINPFLKDLVSRDIDAGTLLEDQGTTIKDEIAYLRQVKAERALVNSDRGISEIAENVGFNNPTAFSRAFKNWTGQSPQEYRRNHQS